MQTLKWVGGVLVLLVLVIGGGYLAGKQRAVSESADMASVIGTTVGFGESLHKVSLLAPAADVSVAIDQAYSRYVSPDLLAQWKLDSTKAAGQSASSPWPQNIEILSSEKQTDGSYVVKGNVLEITSKEAVSGGVAAKYPITLKLQKQKGVWLITSYERGSEVTATTTVQ